MRLLALIFHLVFPPSPPPLAGGLQSALESLVGAEAAPALAAAVWRPGLPSPRLAAAGFAQWPLAIRAGEDSTFNWFSLTKLFTATAVMQLCEEGRATLDTPLLEVLPELRELRPYLAPVTLRHLLSHTAGLSDGPPFFWYRATHLAGQKGLDLERLLAILLPGDGRLLDEPGTRFSYSNTGYILLGVCVERLSGRRYEDYVRERLLRPLGMDHTDFRHLDGSRAAWGHARMDSLEGWLGRKFLDRIYKGGRDGEFSAIHLFYVDHPAYGGLVGPVSDLWKFGAMHLQKGLFQGRRLLRADSVDLMQRPVLARDGRPLPTGLGWRLGAYKGASYVHHVGSGGGYRSELRLYPGYGLLAATLANVQGAEVERVAEAALEEEALRVAGPAGLPTPDLELQGP